jgi:TatD DNase family protein
MTEETAHGAPAPSRQEADLDRRAGTHGEAVSIVTEWFDSHCHVHDERIPDGAQGAVEAAREGGVATMVTVGCDRATSLAAIEVASRFDGVHATVGLHPHDASNGVATIIDLLDTPGIVAVGEAGLDYFYEHSERDIQKGVFAAQIQLAHERDLPLVIHSRDAWDDTFDILRAEGVPTHTIFHCFTGGPEQAQACLDLGANLSFSGIVTFKGAPEVQEAARLCPLDRMLVETDSPYLAPLPHRGKPNRPAWVAHVGQFIADLRDVPVAAVADATTANARRIFAV